MLNTTKNFLFKKTSSWGKSRKKNREYIFNDHNLNRYERDVRKGLDLVRQAITEKEQPFSGILPEELIASFRDINLDLPLKKTDEALAELRQVYLKDAVYFHHPRYVAHLNCPVVYPAIMAELILSSINSSVDTWDQSAGATLIEQKLVDWTREQISLPAAGDGIFTSGGTQSNLMAMLLARDYYCDTYLNGHSVKENGLPECAAKFRIFTSKLSHFSVQKSAALLGLGYESVVGVDYDEHYRMDAAALAYEVAKAQQTGLIPIAVVATTGTTDFGSIDPIHKIADLCQQHNIWFHADAAYGCGLLVSEKHGDKLQGIERADSVTVDYHKSFFQPVSCGAFFVRNAHTLSYVTHHAEYLNPLSAKLEGTPNLVNKSLQTTRRFDALKLWLTLRIMGAKRIGSMFDEVIQRATETYELFAGDGNIDVLHQPEISTLVFRFHPAHNHFEDHQVPDELIDRCNESIRKAIFRSGKAVIAGTKVAGRSYLKFTLLNPETSLQDIEAVLAMIKHEGQAFFAQNYQDMAVASELITANQSGKPTETKPQRIAV
ncbi:pyridoxal phosphate-dependent decarboxylase family protein [Bacterioplanoides sp.]|uniref:pyridoxal phosphate-dependent decarboxylase family protein n=1 Tax=Bacterioplanoides sp. TaxID=2066072 RepID=UPI003AFF915D